MNIPPYYSSEELTDACEWACAERRDAQANGAKLKVGWLTIFIDLIDDAIADAQNREDAEIKQAQDEEQNPEGMTRFDPHCGAGSAR